jgi:NTE family protein
MFEDSMHALARAFPQADSASIREMAAICSFMSVPGGTSLILEGERSDAVYLIVAGLFAVYQNRADGSEVLLTRLGPGDIIGEIGFITGEARSATVKAIRNCELFRISSEDLQAAVAHAPGVFLDLCTTIVRRLRNAQVTPVKAFKSGTFCFLPADGTIDVRALADNVARTLSAFGSVTKISAAEAEGQTSSWFSGLEQQFDYVLFEADASPTSWTKFCLRQCDAIVLLARGEDDPADLAAFGSELVRVSPTIPVFMMLLWRNVILPAKTSAWLKRLSPGAHYHVRCAADISRAARLIAGRGVGVVLSGGGAKGLAHVGVLEALKQQRVPVDVIGGTSIGGIVAALFALEWNLPLMARALAAEFNRRRITDFAFPRIALFSERSLARIIGRRFGGDARIEDTPIPFFCVSTNLTDGISTVHRTGRIETWLRATSAIPGVFPPVIEDGIVYVDGGVLNNLPTDAIRNFGVAYVIAVDLDTDFKRPHTPGYEQRPGPGRRADAPSMLDILWRVGTIGSDGAGRAASRNANIVLKPDVESIALFGWHACEQAIEAGWQVTLQHVDEIKAALPMFPDL